MRALLLAAGIGSRLRPITETVPKCLVPIHGKPLLDYWLDRLPPTNVERILINLHYLANTVRAHVEATSSADRIDLVYEPTLLGTAGTVKANRDWFGTAPFLLAHADNLTDFDLRQLIAGHIARPAGCAITMLAFRTDNPQSCGILELGQNHIVEGFHEKVAAPPGNLANAAVYIVEPEVADFISQFNDSFIDFSTQVIPAFLGRILALENEGYHRDIGTPEGLRRAHDEFLPPVGIS